jgi:hypothetical protein
MSIVETIDEERLPIRLSYRLSDKIINKNSRAVTGWRVEHRWLVTTSRAARVGLTALRKGRRLRGPCRLKKLYHTEFLNSIANIGFLPTKLLPICTNS